MSEENKTLGCFTSAGTDERNWYLARIEPESSRYMQNEVSHGQMIITLLAGANAGGATAMLAYVSQQGPHIPHAFWILALFVTGFLASLFLAVTAYYLSLLRLRNWITWVNQFYNGKLLWRELWSQSKRYQVLEYLPHIFGWASLVLLVVGAGLGVLEIVCVAL